MTKFLDGPAAETVLVLSRAPHYLRAVCDPAWTWDALDQITDTPAADETVVAYVMVAGPYSAHIQRSIKGRRACQWLQGGEYRVVDPQPAEAVLRSTEQWRAWVAAQIGRPLNADGTAADDTIVKE